VLKDEWPRGAIAGVRIYRQHFFTHTLVQLWLHGGRAAILYAGPRATAHALGSALGELLGKTLQIGDVRDPTPTRRIKLKVFPACVEIWVMPRFLDWRMLAPLAVLLAVLIFLDVFFVNLTRDDIKPLPPAIHWRIIRILFWGWIPAIGIIAMVNKLRRKRLVSIVGGKLILMEIAPTSPVRLEWPCPQIRQLGLVRDRSRIDRGALGMTLLTGEEIILLPNLHVNEVKWIGGTLQGIFKLAGLPAGAPESHPTSGG
jgi:hypothetical protein